MSLTEVTGDSELVRNCMSRFPMRHNSLQLAVMLSACALAFAGCTRSAGTGGGKIRIAYIGLTCEAPIFVAYEKGYFKEEGADVELVKTDWDSMKDGLGLGRFDATHTLVAYVLKPIEQGLDVKITGGIHKGCLRIQAGLKTNIHRIEDLRGKRIATSNMGSPPFIFANRALAAHGFDVTRDVTWVVYPADAVELALDNNQIDAVADSEPIGTMLLEHKKVRTIFDEAIDPPFNEEYCCVVSLSGQFAAENPKGAAAVTRALLRAAKWVGENPTAAAKLSVEKRYLASTVEFNSAAISKLTYEPAVSKCREGLIYQAQDLKRAGLLNASTDPAELIRRAWLPLDTVTDQWVAGLKAEHVAGGGPLPADKALAALLEEKPCCSRCCLGG
ncbi:MAG TPA: ABC transporter substrate-binding protein [Tepidisphaeraceae bacterium]|nr:ABC transporter substrate-binding protein [Tepidisphaeraceae bacterium]